MPKLSTATSKQEKGKLDCFTEMSEWGFSSTCCARCGTSNSEISGLLMQCARCKLAHYCGMKCFNLDAERHFQFCLMAGKTNRQLVTHDYATSDRPKILPSSETETSQKPEKKPEQQVRQKSREDSFSCNTEEMDSTGSEDFTEHRVFEGTACVRPDDGQESLESWSTGERRSYR